MRRTNKAGKCAAKTYAGVLAGQLIDFARTVDYYGYCDNDLDDGQEYFAIKQDILEGNTKTYQSFIDDAMEHFGDEAERCYPGICSYADSLREKLAAFA